MSQGLKHLKHSKTHHTSLEKIFDKSMYVVGLVPPVMTIPQLLTVWVQHKSAGISLITWAAYALSSLLWTLYGILHKDKPLTLTNFLLVIMDTGVVLGVLLTH